MLKGTQIVEAGWAEKGRNMTQTIIPCALRTRAYIGKPQALEVREGRCLNTITHATKDYMIMVVVKHEDKNNTSHGGEITLEAMRV